MWVKLLLQHFLWNSVTVPIPNIYNFRNLQKPLINVAVFNDLVLLLSAHLLLKEYLQIATVTLLSAEVNEWVNW